MKSKLVSNCCQAGINIIIGENYHWECKKCGKICHEYVEPKLAAEPKYDWKTELEPYLVYGQGFALKRFIEGLLTRQKKELTAYEGKYKREWYQYGYKDSENLVPLRIKDALETQKKELREKIKGMKLVDLPDVIRVNGEIVEGETYNAIIDDLTVVLEEKV